MIRVLPPEIVNQIAAGEVVERPFSVVKELVENSLDAGAKRLHVAIVDGGRASIRVTDDGCGFGPDDLALAFVSHATSKLASLDDLDHIASLGFRGEALASIGSVARTSIRSRAAGADGGFEIHCEGGAIGDVRPSACPPGSCVEVRDLFFNTKARRRFLKTPRAERARIQELLLRLAIPRPDVDFTFEVDGKEALRLPADEPLLARIERAFGRTIAASLHPLDAQWDDYAVTGFAGDPDLARRDGSMELLFVNGRLARDKASGFAIRQAYREYLMGGRFPVYFVMLSLPPSEVDVNVHPTKSEVRFLDGRRVAGLLHDAVRASLAGRAQQPGGIEGAADAAAVLQVDAGKPRARSGFPSLPPGLFGDPVPADTLRERGLSHGAHETGASFVGEPRSTERMSPLVTSSAPSGVAGSSPQTNERAHPFVRLAAREFLQVADLYIVLEGADGGIVVVDQHALHERVMYERLLRRHRARSGAPAQRLLVPQILDLSPSDKAWLLDAAVELAEEGLTIEDFGGNSIAIHAIPALLDRVQPTALVESFLHGAADGHGAAADGARPSTVHAIHERFHSMACRSSIMSGDPLGQEEIRALLDEARGLEHPHNCPHGRPTVLSFSPPELERFFRRRT